MRIYRVFMSGWNQYLRKTKCFGFFHSLLKDSFQEAACFAFVSGVSVQRLTGSIFCTFFLPLLVVLPPSEHCFHCLEAMGRVMSQGQSLSFCVSERAVVLRLTLEAGCVKDVYSPCEVSFYWKMSHLLEGCWGVWTSHKWNCFYLIFRGNQSFCLHPCVTLLPGFFLMTCSACFLLPSSTSCPEVAYTQWHWDHQH